MDFPYDEGARAFYVRARLRASLSQGQTMDRHASKAFAVSLVIGLDFFSQAAESKDCSLFSREIRLAFYFRFRPTEERVKSLQLVFFFNNHLSFSKATQTSTRTRNVLPTSRH